MQRWMQLLLYAQDGTGGTSPIMQMAVMRAKSLELLSQHHPDARHRTDDARDQAFMVGMLSLVDAVVGMELADILAQLGLDDEVKNAVLEREGYLGQLLSLIEEVERDNVTTTTGLLSDLNLTPSRLNQAGLEAMQWVAGLADEA